MENLSSWLAGLGLERYARVFEDNGVDLDTLPLLSESELEQLGVLLGHRRKLRSALAALSTPSAPDAAAAAPRPAAPTGV